MGGGLFLVCLGDFLGCRDELLDDGAERRIVKPTSPGAYHGAGRYRDRHRNVGLD